MCTRDRVKLLIHHVEITSLISTERYLDDRNDAFKNGAVVLWSHLTSGCGLTELPKAINKWR